MGLEFKYQSFEELTAPALYAILQLRNQVFVVEQNCVYQDADDKDQVSFHVTGWVSGTLAAYCRVLPPGISFIEAGIGRVVVSPEARRLGYGRQLMEVAIDFTLNRFSCKIITISAQLYLQKFYESLGFVQKSEPYLEDNIPHIKMQLST